jgi:hypothetical protein
MPSSPVRIRLTLIAIIGGLLATSIVLTLQLSMYRSRIVDLEKDLEFGIREKIPVRMSRLTGNEERVTGESYYIDREGKTELHGVKFQLTSRTFDDIEFSSYENGVPTHYWAESVNPATPAER